MFRQLWKKLREPRTIRNDRLAHRPMLESLEDRLAPAGVYAVGADAGAAPHVRVFEDSGREVFSFFPYDENFTGGVRVAVGDVNADGIPDIVTAAGPGAGPHVKVFSGRDLTLMASFFAYAPTFTGGVFVAVGDVDNDGVNEVVTGPDAGKGPRIRVFDIGPDGATQLPGAVGSFLAYERDFIGGARVAVGNVDGVEGDEIIVAPGPGVAHRVKVFDGDRAVLASFFAFEQAFRGGVYVATGDVNGDGVDEIITGAGPGGGPHVRVFDGTGATLDSFFAFDPGFTGGVRVAAGDVNGDEVDDIVASAGPGAGPHVRVFDGLTGAEIRSLFAFPEGFAGGVHLGAGSFTDRLTSDNFFIRIEPNVLDRLARFDPGATTNPSAPAVAQWVPVAANDANLVGKNVYFVAHGWAPGFLDMVNAYAEDNPGDFLKWWQTLNTSLRDSPGGPNSTEMFFGSAGGGIFISPVGVAQGILNADPNAVVVAYSWVDESATKNVLDKTIPAGAYVSEAYTFMNGLRLATAIEIVLGSNLGSTPVHIIGHSHGSKVATVATQALHLAGTNVDQLTILDSPENTESGLVDANNFNWFYLGDLPLGRGTAGTTFVDNYVSQFGITFGNRQGVDPFNPTTTSAALQQVVDVSLEPGVILGITDLGTRHSYSFNWYGAASYGWSQNPLAENGIQWSPILDAATTMGLAGGYEQSWTEKTEPQFAVDVTQATNSVDTKYTFSAVPLEQKSVSGNASFNSTTQEITLTASGTNNASFKGEFDVTRDLRIQGVSFEFEFTAPGDGDQLIISVDTGFGRVQEVHFVMTGFVAGTTKYAATLSLGSIAPSTIIYPIIEAKLVSNGGTDATVTIRNLHQFQQDLF